jgi:hypothetical protein
LAVLDQLLRGAIPGPALGHREGPQTQVKRPHVRPEVPHLLLTGPDHLLEVAKAGLQTEPTRDQTQDVRHGRFGVGAEEGPPALGLVHQDHPDRPAGRTPGRHERLVPLHGGFPVQHEGAPHPTATLAGSFGQVDPSLAVDPRPTPPPRRSRLGQRPQGGVLPQAADDDDPQADHRLQEGCLGVSPVGHDPQRLSPTSQPTSDPLHQVDGHLQLGGEGRAVLGVEAGQILPAEIEPCQQRQGDHAPGGVGDQGREDHPDVAVDERAAGGPRGRVVVNAGPLDLRPGARRRRVIQGEDQSGGVLQQRLQDGEEHSSCDPLSPPTRGPEGRVTGSILAAEAGGPNPARDSPTPARQQGSDEQPYQSRARPDVESRSQGRKPVAERRCRRREGHGRVRPGWWSLGNAILLGGPAFVYPSRSLAQQ